MGSDRINHLSVCMQDARGAGCNIISIDHWLGALSESVPVLGLDRGTFIHLLLITRVVIELPVRVSAWVETEAGPC